MTVLCVDNTPIMLQSLAENATKAFPQADVQKFLTSESAWSYAEKTGCDILLCEINPPRLDGIFLAEKIQKINPRVNIIFVTVCSESEHAKEVLGIKPSGYLVKPAKQEQLEAELTHLRYHVS